MIDFVLLQAASIQSRTDLPIHHQAELQPFGCVYLGGASVLNTYALFRLHSRRVWAGLPGRTSRWDEKNGKRVEQAERLHSGSVDPAKGGKLYRAHSRLYRRRIWQAKALFCSMFQIYKIIKLDFQNSVDFSQNDSILNSKLRIYQISVKYVFRSLPNLFEQTNKTKSIIFIKALSELQGMLEITDIYRTLVS
jgi:hypothetical protein